MFLSTLLYGYLKFLQSDCKRLLRSLQGMYKSYCTELDGGIYFPRVFGETLNIYDLITIATLDFGLFFESD